MAETDLPQAAIDAAGIAARNVLDDLVADLDRREALGKSYAENRRRGRRYERKRPVVGVRKAAQR